jgi:hypothetical protein
VKVQKGGFETTKTNELLSLLAGVAPKNQPRGSSSSMTGMEKTWSAFRQVNAGLFTSLDAAREAEALINQSTSVGDAMAKVKLIRMSGDTRPSDYDAKQFNGNRKLLERAKQWYDTNFDTGAFTDLNRDEIRQVMRGIYGVVNSRLKQSVDGFAQTVPDYHPGISPEQAKRALLGRLQGIYTPETGSAPKVTSPPTGKKKDRSGMTIKELRAEAAARGVK